MGFCGVGGFIALAQDRAVEPKAGLIALFFV